MTAEGEHQVNTKCQMDAGAKRNIMSFADLCEVVQDNDLKMKLSKVIGYDDKGIIVSPDDSTSASFCYTLPLISHLTESRQGQTDPSDVEMLQPTAPLSSAVLSKLENHCDCGKLPVLDNGSPDDKFISQNSIDVGQRVTYRCYPGYVFKEGSSRYITCKADSTWSPLNTACEPRNCGNPGEILNGYFNATSTTFGEQVTFYCDAGYRIVGRAYRICDRTGWDGQIPTCEPVECHRPGLIANAQIISGFGPIYKYQETIAYRCLEGFEMIGNSVIKCGENNVFVPPPPKCIPPVRCPQPELIANGQTISGFKATYGYRETITYACTDGYEMVGSNVIECSENNVFVPPPPMCQPPVTCADLPLISKGITPSPPNGNYWEYGMIAQYSCHNGNSLIGAETLVCTENGEWDKDPPTCKVVRCIRPESFLNGQIVAGFGPIYRYRHTITFRCNKGFEMVGKSVIECHENSTFVPPPPTCRPPANCGNPRKILNGYYNTSGTTIGSKAVFSCHKGYKVVGRSFQFCTTSGWNGRVPTCEIVRCHLPELPANGKIVAGFGPMYKYRDTITYSCNEGYEMIGNRIIECTENKAFVPSPPTCKPFTGCQRPDQLANGHIVTGFGPSYKHRETITYSCNEGYEMYGSDVIECSENNIFVPPPPTCRTFIKTWGKNVTLCRTR
ncbi:C4b-binding protein alpha chain-like [Cetorhinus maximus]